MLPKKWILLKKDMGTIDSDGLAYGDSKKEVATNWNWESKNILKGNKKNLKKWGHRY